MPGICMWCNKELYVPEGYKPVISDGICRSCSENLLFQMGVDLQRFLDSLPGPIVLVDSGGMIRTGNSRARTLLGKELLQTEPHLTGEVFECEYSRLPGGCGRTIHCSGCAIRRSFTETFVTGKPVRNISAFLNKESRKINLFISTEKTGGFVLLRIDEMK